MKPLNPSSESTNGVRFWGIADPQRHLSSDACRDLLGRFPGVAVDSQKPFHLFHDESESTWKVATGSSLDLDHRGCPCKPIALTQPGPFPLHLGLQLSWDDQEEELCCSRGHLAQVGLCYAFRDGVLFFADRLTTLLQLLGKRPPLDEATMAGYLQLYIMDGERTFYRGTKRLEPGGELRFSRKGLSVAWRPPWLPEKRKDSLSELAQDLHARLTGSVEHACEGQRVGVLLSGGIDSSSLAALAPRNSEAFHFFLPQNREDTDCARTAAAHLSMPLHEVDVPALDPFAELESAFALLGQPHGNINAFMNHAAARLARERGVTILLDGTDGDCVFSRGHDLPLRFLKRGKILSLARIIRSLRKIEGVPYRTMLKKWLMLPLLPPHLREVISRSGQQHQWIRSDWLRSCGVEEAMACSDAEEYARFRGDQHLEDIFSSINAEIFEETATLRPIDGIRTEFPYFDPAVAELALAVPDEMKIIQEQNRVVLRRALSGQLPDAVLWRRGKGSLATGCVAALAADSSLGERWENISTFLEPYVDTRAAREDLVSFQSSPTYQQALRLWPLFSLGHWLKSLNFAPDAGYS